jgi:hypothetical protein
VRQRRDTKSRQSPWSALRSLDRAAERRTPRRTRARARLTGDELRVPAAHQRRQHSASSGRRCAADSRQRAAAAPPEVRVRAGGVGRPSRGGRALSDACDRGGPATSRRCAGDRITPGVEKPSPVPGRSKHSSKSMRHLFGSLIIRVSINRRTGQLVALGQPEKLSSLYVIVDYL